MFSRTLQRAVGALFAASALATTGNGGAGLLAFPSALSCPPRTGSRIASLTSNAAGNPARPTMMKAERQSRWVAIQPPKNTPSAEPIGMPSEKKASARARCAFGK